MKKAQPNNASGQPSCNRCGGMHFGSSRCPYLDEARCSACNGFIATETGNDYSVHPNRKFDGVGRAYHVSCEFLPTETRDPIARKIADLKAAGWEPALSTVWKSPSGALFRGPVFAWEMMKSHPKLNIKRTPAIVALKPEDTILA